MKIHLNQEKKIILHAIGYALAIVGASVIMPIYSHAQLTDFNINESDYSIKSCGDPLITEDRPNAQEIDPENPPELGSLGDDGADFNLDEVGTGARDTFQNPVVRMGLYPEAPRQGELIDIFAENRYFKTQENDVYSTWCINGITQQGLAAGGKETEKTIASYPAMPCCNPSTRTPDADTDKDGLDDEWELFYFEGKKINGTQYPTDRAGVLSAVKPDDDLDQDGYCATTFRKSVAPNRGAAVTIAPSSVTAPRLQSDGSEGQDTYKTGDCSFPNAEEFIWGTDPTSQDTDADGYSDEADLAGQGQQNLSYTSKKKILDADPDQIRVTSVGMSLKGLIKIDSYVRSVVVGKGEALMIDIQQQPKNPRPGEDIKLSVSMMNTDKPPEALHYTWKLNGIKMDGSKITIPMDESKNGFGKQELMIDKAQITSEMRSLKVSVHVVEKIAQEITKDADKEVEIKLGNTFDLTYTPDCVDNGTGNKNCPVRDGTVEVTAEASSFRGPLFDGKSVEERKNIFDDLELKWYIDDALQKYGNGIDATKTSFITSKMPGQTHHVELRVMGKGNVQIAREAVDIRIYGPEVLFNAQPGLNAKYELVVRPGTQAWLIAVPKNFRESSVNFSYKWNIDPDLLEAEEVRQSSNYLEFTPTKSNRSYTVTMTVEGAPVIGSSGNPTEVASRSVHIRVVDDITAQNKEQNRVIVQAKSLMASTVTFIKNFLNNSFSAFARHS